MFWTHLFGNRHIPYKLHYYFLSFSISVLNFLSRSTKNKGNINATGTYFELKDVDQVMDFKVFESALRS